MLKGLPGYAHAPAHSRELGNLHLQQRPPHVSWTTSTRSPHAASWARRFAWTAACAAMWRAVVPEPGRHVERYCAHTVATRTDAIEEASSMPGPEISKMFGKPFTENAAALLLGKSTFQLGTVCVGFAQLALHKILLIKGVIAQHAGENGSSSAKKPSSMWRLNPENVPARFLT